MLFLFILEFHGNMTPYSTLVQKQRSNCGWHPLAHLNLLNFTDVKDVHLFYFPSKWHLSNHLTVFKFCLSNWQILHPFYSIYLNNKNIEVVKFFKIKKKKKSFPRTKNFFSKRKKIFLKKKTFFYKKNLCASVFILDTFILCITVLRGLYKVNVETYRHHK